MKLVNICFPACFVAVKYTEENMLSQLSVSGQFNDTVHSSCYVAITTPSLESFLSH